MASSQTNNKQYVFFQKKKKIKIANSKNQEKITDYDKLKNCLRENSTSNLEIIDLEHSNFINLKSYPKRSIEVINLIEEPKEEIEIKDDSYQYKFCNSNVLNDNNIESVSKLNNSVNFKLDFSFFNNTFQKNNDIDGLMKKRDRNIFLSKNNSVFFKNFDIEYDIDLENTDIKNPLLKTEFMNIDRSDVKHLIYEGDSTNTNTLEMIIIEWTNSVDNCQLPKWNVILIHKNQYLDTNLILNERIIEFLNYEKKETFCHCEDKCNNITFCPCARFNFLFNQTISCIVFFKNR